MDTSNETAGPVAVLAVEYLRELAGDYKRVGHDETAAEIEAQAAAVAALVEMARIVSNFDGLHTKNIRAMPFADEAMNRLRAALAKFGGAK